MNDDDKFLTRKQAADRFRVTTRTIDRWRSLGLIRAVAIGGVVRFRPEDLRAAVRRSLT